MDQISLDRLKLLHPKLRDEAFEIYEEILKAGVNIRVIYTLRTFAEQDALYAQGRTKPGKIITKAKGGLSMHNYGLAIDFAILKDGKQVLWDLKVDLDKDGKSDWMEVVTIFKQYGWTWGGDWKFFDAPHFEKSFGYSVRQLLNLYNAKKVDAHNYVLI